MEPIELTVKSLDDAKSEAAAKFGVDPTQVTVTVLEETKGLFGKTNYRVRAEVLAAPAEKKATKPTRGKKVATEPVLEDVASAAEAAPEEPEAKPAKAPRGRAKKEAAPAEETPAAASEENEVQATGEDVERFVTTLNRLLEKTGLKVQAHSSGTTGKYVNVHFDGVDTGYLVGKHGEVLNSFQYLTNIIAAQQWGNGIRCVLDGNDFRGRREEQLTQLAVKIAEQVRKRGEEAVLDAIPAFERRIVHKALAEMEGVTTYSEGEEPNRRVVIAPAE